MLLKKEMRLKKLGNIKMLLKNKMQLLTKVLKVAAPTDDAFRWARQFNLFIILKKID